MVRITDQLHLVESEEMPESAFSEIPRNADDFPSSVVEEVKTVSSSKARTVRNVVILGISYLLFFTGFWPLSNLQSTMNAQGGMGVDSQALIYLFSMISCFFPELVIRKLGTKYTFIISVALSIPYVASNIHLRWDTMIATSVLFGLVSGPMNSAVTCYLDEMSVRYAASSKQNLEYISSLLFGMYAFFSEFTNVGGNVIAYYTLLKGRPLPPNNISVTAVCGVYFDPNAQNNTNLNPPSDQNRYMLIGTFIVLGIISVVFALLLDPLRNDMGEVRGCRSVYQRIISSVKFLKNPHLLLLLPLTVFLGLMNSFYAGVFTEAFIACSWGVHHVGFVNICFGVCGTLMAASVGLLVKCISQMYVILLAALTNLSLYVLLFLWKPSPEQPVAYFAFAGVFGMTDAILWSQVAALYGLTFPNDREAAFSNFFFWSFLGLFMSYSSANYLSVAVKIYIMLSILIVGITLFLVGQIKIKCFSNRRGEISAICEKD